MHILRWLRRKLGLCSAGVCGAGGGRWGQEVKGQTLEESEEAALGPRCNGELLPRVGVGEKDGCVIFKLTFC